MIDTSGDGLLSAAEVIKAVRTNPRVAHMLGLDYVRQEDGSRDAFERTFQEMDSDGNRKIDRSEFVAYFLGAAGKASSSEAYAIVQRPHPPSQSHSHGGPHAHAQPHSHAALGHALHANADAQPHSHAHIHAQHAHAHARSHAHTENRSGTNLTADSQADGTIAAQRDVQACSGPIRHTAAVVPSAGDLASAHAMVRRLSELEAEVHLLRAALADEGSRAAVELRGVRIREAELHSERSRQRKHEEERRKAEREAEVKAREALLDELLMQRTLVARQEGQLRSFGFVWLTAPALLLIIKPPRSFRPGLDSTL